jgi:hypothetical protein
MKDEADFLIEEYKSLKDEIRMRQSQILDSEKGLILLLTSIYSVLFFKAADPYLLLVLASIAPFATVLTFIKVGQNASRILEISDYIKKTEHFFLAKRSIDGYEHTLRPLPSTSIKLQKLLGPMFAMRAEPVLICLIFIFTVAVCWAIAVGLIEPQKVKTP